MPQQPDDWFAAQDADWFAQQTQPSAPPSTSPPAGEDLLLANAKGLGAGLMKGVGDVINPMTYIRTAQALGSGLAAAPGALIRASFNPTGTLQTLGRDAKAVFDRINTQTTAEDVGRIGGNVIGAKVVPAAIGRLVQKVAPSVYGMGVGQTPTMKQDFPDAAAQGVREGIIPTPNRVQRVLTQAERETQRAVRGYDAANPPSVDSMVLTGQAAGSAIDKGRIAARGIHSEGLDEINDLVGRTLTDTPGPLTLGRTLDLKRAEEIPAAAAYKAAARGRAIGEEEKLFHKGLADAARNVVRTRAPEAATQLDREQNLIGLLQGANRPAPSGLRHMFAAGLGSGGLMSGNPLVGLAGAATVEGMRSPYLMGGIGIGIDRTGQALASPAMRRAAILAALQQQFGRSTTFPPEPTR